MWSRLKRSWLSVIGALALVPPLCKSLWHLVGHAGDVDFFVSHIRDLGWANDMITWLLDPPGWSIPLMIGGGLLFIYIDTRQRISRAASVGLSSGTHEAIHASSIAQPRPFTVGRLGPRQKFPIAMVAIAVCAVLIVSGMLWWFEHSRSHPASEAARTEPSKFSAALICNMSVPPKKPPPEGHVYVLSPGSSDVEVIGLSERGAMPNGGDWDWGGADLAYRCGITNTSDRFINNLIIVLRLSFLKFRDFQKNGEEKKSHYAQRGMPIRIPSIASGSTFVFYAINFGAEDVIIDLPSQASVFGSENKAIIIDLISGQSRFFTLPALTSNQRGASKK